MSLSSSAWFTGDDGPADPPSERPVPPVAAPVSPRTLPVTPAERCLAAMLRAWLDYSPSDECNVDQQNALADIGNRLRRLGVTNTLKATPAGAALLARVEAAERTPAAVLRAMLNSATEAAIEAERRYYLAARNSDEEHTADREVADLSERINSIRGCLAHALTGASPLIPSEWQADYAARLAGTTPIDAPPAKEPR